MNGKGSLAFILGGQTFHTKPILSSVPFMGSLDDPDSTTRFISSMLTSYDRQVFHDLMDDTDAFVSIQQLDDIADWLVEEMSGRPTGSPVSFGSGGGRISATSKGSSLAVARTGA